jgi:hypothetical protein
MIVQLILSTDMAKHFEILVNFRQKYLTKETDFENFEERLMLLQIAIKCADIGHAAKEVELHEKWSLLIVEEFYNQGDTEKEEGLPVSMFCDREKTDLSGSQSGFITNLV